MKKNIKVIILSLLVIFSIILEVTGVSVMLGSSYAYIIKPVIWIFIGIIAFIFFKSERLINTKYKKDVDFIVIVAILLYYLIYFLLGYVKGFANNPYDTSIRGMLLNLWSIVPIIISREYIRCYIVNNCNQKKILWWTLIVSLVFTIIELNFNKFPTYFGNSEAFLKFIMQTFIPSLMVNLFLSYLSYFSGVFAPIVYALVPYIINYTLPILPNIDWSIISILNCTIPFFSYVYINYIINKWDKLTKKKRIKVVDLKGLILMISFVGLMILFGLGVFPIEPLVIASNSMYPKIHRGDIVILKETPIEKVKVGDTIRYRMEGYSVVHRVKSIEKDADGNMVFITKGDNNRDVDLYPVKTYQFDGVVLFDIRYVGYPTLILNELLNSSDSSNVSVDLGKTA